jgi:hypothetical protein
LLGLYVLIYIASILGLVGNVIQSERLSSVAKQCLSNALACSVFGAITGVMGTVASNMFLRHLPPRKAIASGFLWGSAISGYVGVLLFAANALGNTMTEGMSFLITGFALWLSFLYGAFQRPARQNPGATERSENAFTLSKERWFSLGRRVCVSILGVCVLVFGWMLLTTGGVSEDGLGYEGSAARKRLDAFLMIIPLTTVLSILGAVAGMVSALFGGAIASLYRESLRFPFHKCKSEGGQIGMIGGAIAGAIVLLLSLYWGENLDKVGVRTRPKSIAATPWLLFALAVAPALVDGFFVSKLQDS